MENKKMSIGETMFQAKQELVKVATCVRQPNPKDLKKEADIWLLKRYFELTSEIFPINGLNMSDRYEYQNPTYENFFEDEVNKIICQLSENIINEKIYSLRNYLDFSYLSG